MRARAERYLELELAEIVSGATERVVGGVFRLDSGQRRRCRGVIIVIGTIESPDDPWAGAAIIEPADFRLPEEEPVGQQYFVAARAVLLQPLDIAALGLDREDEAAAQRPVFCGVVRDPDIPLAAAKPGELHGRTGHPTPRRVNRVIQILIDERGADHRSRAVADSLAQIAAGKQWITTLRTGLVDRVVGSLVEGDLIIIESIAAEERGVFGQRHTHSQLQAGRCLLVSGGRLAEIAVVVIAAVDIHAQ